MPLVRRRFKRRFPLRRRPILRKKVAKINTKVNQLMRPMNNVAATLYSSFDCWETGVATTNFAFGYFPEVGYVTNAAVGIGLSTYAMAIYKANVRIVIEPFANLPPGVGGFYPSFLYRVIIVRESNPSISSVSPNGNNRSSCLLYPASVLVHNGTITADLNREILPYRGKRSVVVLYDKVHAVSYADKTKLVNINLNCKGRISTFTQTAANTWQSEQNVYKIFVTSNKPTANAANLPGSIVSCGYSLQFKNAM